LPRGVSLPGGAVQNLPQWRDKSYGRYLLHTDGYGKLFPHRSIFLKGLVVNEGELVFPLAMPAKENTNIPPVFLTADVQK